MAVAAVEDTLVIFKPDALERAMVATLLDRFERAGLVIAALKVVRPDAAAVAAHYKEHVGKDFYASLEKYLLRGPSICLVLRGFGAIGICRKLRGSTDPAVALPGTICGDFGHALIDGQNLVHASSDAVDAAREISLWFAEGEILA